jgi:hypothetical protein
MGFKNWLETVGGVKRFQMAAQVSDGYPKSSAIPFKDLGNYGWFRAYSAKTKTDGVDPEWGMSVYSKDDFAEGFKGDFLMEISRRLQGLGFSRIRVNVIFQDNVSKADAEGTHEPQLHVIRVQKDLDPKRMMHVVAHEWAHALWKSLPKRDKESFSRYWVNSFGRSSNLSSYSFTGGPAEKFCELVAEAVADPSSLSRDEMKLVQMIAGKSMPEHELGGVS